MKTVYLIALLSLAGLSFLVGDQQGKVEHLTLFDGKTLKGWKVVNPANAERWTVVDGCLASGDGKTKIPTNTFLATTEEYGDFEFTCKFRLWGDQKTGMINSGIQYRSHAHGTNTVGYQADMGRGWWGGIYDEHRRNVTLAKCDVKVLGKDFKEDGWHTYTIRCKGNHHELFIDGIKTVDYIEKDSSVPAKGFIAVQIHSGGKAQVAFKDLTLKKL